MMVSRESAQFWDGLGKFALLDRQLGIEEEAGHADDAVHGRADLVAHVGEELALGAGGDERGVAGGTKFGFDAAAGAQFAEGKDIDSRRGAD